MKFTIELDIGLSFLLQSALPLANDRSRDNTHRRGRSMRSTALASAELRSRKRKPRPECRLATALRDERKPWRPRFRCRFHAKRQSASAVRDRSLETGGGEIRPECALEDQRLTFAVAGATGAAFRAAPPRAELLGVPLLGCAARTVT
jgi:hypothetical protein